MSAPFAKTVSDAEAEADIVNFAPPRESYTIPDARLPIFYMPLGIYNIQISPTPTPNPLDYTQVHASMALLQSTSKYKKDVAHCRS